MEKPKLHYLTLVQNTSSSTLGHYLTNCEGPESAILHSTFRGNRSTGSGGEDFRFFII